KTDLELQEKLKNYIEETKALMASMPQPPPDEPKVPQDEPPPSALTVPLPIEDTRPKPIYKKPWFWGVVGGVGGAVIITAVVVGVVVGLNQPNPSLPELRF